VAYGVWLMQEQRNGVPTQAGLEVSSALRIAATLGGEACRGGALRWPLDNGGQGSARARERERERARTACAKAVEPVEAVSQGLRAGDLEQRAR
jgi:hypothetical protein